MRRTIEAALFLVALSIPPAIRADASLVTSEINATANRLIDQALADDLAYRLVESLTTEVGPRLAGTLGEARARARAENMFKDLGFKRIRVEPFEVRLWTRGRESAEITSPFAQPLAITALGNSVATSDGSEEGQVVRFESIADLIEAPAQGLENKIVFVDERMTRTQDGSGYRVAVPLRSQAALEAGRRGALAAVIRSTGTDHHRFPHTGSMRYAKGVKPVPIGALSAPDAEQLARALERGPVRLKLVLEVNGGGRSGGVGKARLTNLHRPAM